MAVYLNETHEKHRKFFFEVAKLLPSLEEDKPNCVAVLHILPDALPFYEALSSVFEVSCIIPKPKSVDEQTLQKLPQHIILRISRDEICENFLLKILNTKKKTVFLDIGGYFAQSIKTIKNILGDNFLGIIEDTENGLQKYENNCPFDIPLFQVARSPLKDNEDYMVGHAITYSFENILRNHNLLINGLSIGIFGYGKLGESIATSLSRKQARISVFDIDAVKQVQAFSRGFSHKEKEHILENSDALCLATGKKSISGKEWVKIKKGAFVFSVTSSDDELDTHWLVKNYKNTEVSQYIARWERNGHYFYLLNGGNAINFIHGTTVGDFILLVHAELLCDAYLLTRQKYLNGIHELDTTTRKKIAEIWLSIFGK